MRHCTDDHELRDGQEADLFRNVGEQSLNRRSDSGHEAVSTGKSSEIYLQDIAEFTTRIKS